MIAERTHLLPQAVLTAHCFHQRRESDTLVNFRRIATLSISRSWMQRLVFLLLALVPLTLLMLAQTAAPKPAAKTAAPKAAPKIDDSQVDPRLYAEMHWRAIGPPRAGRARAISAYSFGST